MNLKNSFKVGCIGAALIASNSILGSNAEDPLAPRSSINDAITSPLHAISLISDNAREAKRFYEQGMGLSCREEAISDAQKTLWRLPTSDWLLHRCTRPSTDGGIEVRLLSSNEPGQETRADFGATRNGILSLGFAIDDIEAHTAHMEELGYKTNDGITTITLPTTSGGTYVVKESHYKGPHFSYNLGISRPKGFDQVAQVDVDTGVGGPAYSGVIVPDADIFKAFMQDILGFEARRDIEFESSGPGGGLVGLAKGTKVRFIQMYSPGSTTDYMIVMSMGDAGLNATAELLPPSRGLIMMSYQTGKFDDVLARVQEAELAELAVIKVGSTRNMTFRAPNGTLVEISEQQ